MMMPSWQWHRRDSGTKLPCMLRVVVNNTHMHVSCSLPTSQKVRTQLVQSNILLLCTLKVTSSPLNRRPEHTHVACASEPCLHLRQGASSMLVGVVAVVVVVAATCRCNTVLRQLVAQTQQLPLQLFVVEGQPCCMCMCVCGNCLSTYVVGSTHVDIACLST